MCTLKSTLEVALGRLQLTWAIHPQSSNLSYTGALCAAHTHTHTHIHTHIKMYLCACAHTHTHVRTHTCTHTNTCAHTHTHCSSAPHRRKHRHDTVPKESCLQESSWAPKRTCYWQPYSSMPSSQRPDDNPGTPKKKLQMHLLSWI